MNESNDTNSNKRKNQISSELIFIRSTLSNIINCIHCIVVGAPINKAKLAMYRRKTFQETTMSTTVSNTKPKFIISFIFISFFYYVFIIFIQSKNLSHTRNHFFFWPQHFVNIFSSLYFSLFFPIFIYCTIYSKFILFLLFTCTCVQTTINICIFKFHVLFRSRKPYWQAIIKLDHKIEITPWNLK